MIYRPMVAIHVPSFSDGEIYQGEELLKEISILNRIIGCHVFQMCLWLRYIESISHDF